MSITESWRAGREAVAQFSLFCARQGWVFAEVPEQADFGKDGYVDLATDEGAVPGNCFAVQIKGGRSRWSSGGYRIDASAAQRRRWARSTMPVIGIAFDPNNDWIHWCDLSALLRDNLDANLVVPREQHLNGGPELARFTRYIGAATQPQSSLLDLASDDPERQEEAAFVCYFVGRVDGRSLILLRRMLFSLSAEAQAFGVWQLSRAVPHPDMLHTSNTMVSKEARALLGTSLQWTAEEVIDLLRLVDDDGFDRGSLGQSIFYLLVEDPELPKTLESVALKAIQDGDEHVASWALVLTIYLAGEDGQARLDSILEVTPALRQTWAAPQLRDALADFGHVTLF